MNPDQLFEVEGIETEANRATLENHILVERRTDSAARPNKELYGGSEKD
jgi:hypothetical protein